MKRKLIYCPEINDSSVVLFFEKGDQGAWSVRDYSQSGTVTVRYAREFNFSPRSLSELIRQSIEVPVVSTTDLDFWHRLTMEANAGLALVQPVASTLPMASEASDKGVERASDQFQMLEKDRLMALPKALKGSDMRRMLYSPNSEDWVTWNAFAIVESLAPATWWQDFVGLARHENPALALPDGWAQRPTVSLWRCVPAPRDYEKNSRARLNASRIDEWISRSQKPGPVEGDSEIDITIQNDALTLFVEAKLSSDISARTKYDPERNQIVRNIDCLIDNARSTVPMFWMLVRDSGAGRAYTQLIEKYRNHPALLVEALPHRDPLVLRQIAQRFSMILWKDFLAIAPKPTNADGLTNSVYQELRMRIA
jgi:hypothetical protein